MTTCLRCGVPDLEWHEDDAAPSGWRLHHQDGRKHICEIVAGHHDRNSVYGAVDEMNKDELCELIEYARTKL